MLPSKLVRSVVLILALFLLASNAGGLKKDGAQELILIVVGFIFLLVLPIICLIICLVFRLTTKRNVYAAGIYAGLGLPAVYFGLLYLDSDGRHPQFLHYSSVFIVLLLIYVAIELIVRMKKR